MRCGVFKRDNGVMEFFSFLIWVIDIFKKEKVRFDGEKRDMFSIEYVEFEMYFWV